MTYQEPPKKHYPVDANGNMLEYTDYYNNAGKWLPMEPFYAQLSFQNYTKGRSSLRFILKDIADDAKYSLMAQSIDEFVLNSNNGILLARWNVVKRGANWGLIIEEVL